MQEVCLPLAEAIELEAKQNFERDIKMGIVMWYNRKEYMPIYRQEAKILLEKEGEGYLPDYPHHKLVKVKK